jgi:hypothetical protein
MNIRKFSLFSIVFLFLQMTVAQSLSKEKMEKIKEMSNTESEISIKELYKPAKYDMNWSNDAGCICRGDLRMVLTCLLRVDYGRIQVRGKTPKNYLDLSIREPDRYFDANEDSVSNDSIVVSILPLDGAKILSIVEKKELKNKGDLNSTTFAYMALQMIQKRYHVQIRKVQDTIDVWGLQRIHSSKLVPYEGKKGGSAGFDTLQQAWVSTRMSLKYLCEAAAEKTKAMIYDETNSNDRFDFTIPKQYFQTMEELNQYLLPNYGLRFMKRRQVEPIFILEFQK